VSRYQKGKTNLDFTEARDSEWQWNLLGCMQVCTSLQTDNHASTLLRRGQHHMTLSKFWGPKHIIGTDDARHFKFGMQIDSNEK